MTPTSVRLLAILALLALPVTAIAWDTDCRFSAERRGSLDTSGAERVEILARAADLDLRPATGSTVSAAGNVVQVHVQVPERMEGIGIFHASLDLQVQVPTDLPVHVTDSSGDTTLDGVRVVRLQDSSGDIVARGLLADIEIDDVDGNVELRRDGSGQVRVTDVRGTVRVP